MTENIDPNDIEDCQKQVFDLEAEAQEIRQLGMRYMVDLASMTARATRAEAALVCRLLNDHYRAISERAQLERWNKSQPAPAGGEALAVNSETGQTYLREMAEALELSEKSKMVAANELRELRADCAAFCGQNERLIKAAGAENLDGAIAAIEAQRAALERARALSEKWREQSRLRYSGAAIATMSDCADELAAALGSGGAA